MSWVLEPRQALCSSTMVDVFDSGGLRTQKHLETQVIYPGSGFGALLLAICALRLAMVILEFVVHMVALC
jgi:hypothetical protein